MRKRKFLRVLSSTQPQTTQCLALPLCLSYGKTPCERPCNTFVVPSKSCHHEQNERGPVVGWTEGAGAPGDCGLSNFSKRQNREKQPCGAGRHEFWSFFMACLISLLRAPTNTVRLVSALLPVYRWVNCTSPYPPHPENKKNPPKLKYTALAVFSHSLLLKYCICYFSVDSS